MTLDFCSGEQHERKSLILNHSSIGDGNLDLTSFITCNFSCITNDSVSEKQPFQLLTKPTINRMAIQLKHISTIITVSFIASWVLPKLIYMLVQAALN